MRSQFTSYEQLPITLTADHVAAALGISRANAYILFSLYVVLSKYRNTVY